MCVCIEVCVCGGGCVRASERAEAATVAVVAAAAAVVVGAGVVVVVAAAAVMVAVPSCKAWRPSKIVTLKCSPQADRNYEIQTQKRFKRTLIY